MNPRSSSAPSKPSRHGAAFRLPSFTKNIKSGMERWCTTMKFFCWTLTQVMRRWPGCELTSSKNWPNALLIIPSSRGIPDVRLLSALAGLALLAGCAGYHLGPTNGLSAGEKSIQIAPFVNQTRESRLTDAVTQQLRKELQRDGTFQLAAHGGADIIVTGSLLRYLRSEVTLATTDILTVRDFRLSLTAHLTARERATGRVLLDQPVTGSTLIRAGADLTSAERQGLPLLADDLAKNATALLVEGKW